MTCLSLYKINRHSYSTSTSPIELLPLVSLRRALQVASQREGGAWDLCWDEGCGE